MAVIAHKALRMVASLLTGLISLRMDVAMKHNHIICSVVMVLSLYVCGYAVAGVGTTYLTALPKVPCFLDYDPCSEDYRLMLGAAWGLYDSSRSANANALYDSDCDEYTNVGELSSDDYLVVFVVNSYAISSSSTDSGVVKFYVDLFEYTDDECDGGITRNFNMDTSTCSVTVAGGVGPWLSAWSETAGHCGNSWGDPGNCHQPDIGITYPGAPGTYCYRFYVMVSVCNADGSSCTSDYEYGYFTMNWVV